MKQAPCRRRKATAPARNRRNMRDIVSLRREDGGPIAISTVIDLSSMVHTDSKMLEELLALDDDRWRVGRTSMTKLPPLRERPQEVQRVFAGVAQLIDQGFRDVVGELSDEGFLFFFEGGKNLLAVMAPYAKHINVHVPYGLEIRGSDFDHEGAIIGTGRFNQRVRVEVAEWPLSAKRRNVLLRILRRSLALAKKHGNPFVE